MNPHDTDFDEGEERVPLQRPAHPGPDDRPAEPGATGKERDRDRDGLPDDPAKYRVPS